MILSFSLHGNIECWCFPRGNILCFFVSPNYDSQFWGQELTYIHVIGMIYK